MTTPAAAPRSVVVVGGGISGLAAAWFLHQRSPTTQVSVLEGSSQIGGKLRLGTVAEAPLDLGAESLLLFRPEASRLASEAGLTLAPAATTTAAIWSRGALRPVPGETVMGVPASVRALADSGLLTRAELARVRLDKVLPARPRGGADIAVADLVRSRLGAAVLDRLVEPLLGGVYAGRADHLSVLAALPQLAPHLGRHRSLLAAARAARPGTGGDRGPVFGAPVGGVGLLPDAVADASQAHVRTSVTVRDLRRAADGWTLVAGSAAAPELVDADAVVLALPPAPAARLLGDWAPPAAAALAEIPTASSAVVALAFRSGSVALPPGSGFLVPACEGRTIKGVTFSSTKWGWHAQTAPGLVLVRASVGRFGDESTLQRSDEQLVDLVRGDLADLLGWAAQPVDAVVQRWGGGLPQYTVGHLNRVARIREAMSHVPGLVLCGAAYDGVGVPACIASADRAVTDLLSQWDSD